MRRPKRWVGPDQEMTIINADGTVAAEILQNDIQKLNRALYKKERGTDGEVDRDSGEVQGRLAMGEIQGAFEGAPSNTRFVGSEPLRDGRLFSMPRCSLSQSAGWLSTSPQPASAGLSVSNVGSRDQSTPRRIA